MKHFKLTSIILSSILFTACNFNTIPENTDTQKQYITSNTDIQNDLEILKINHTLKLQHDLINERKSIQSKIKKLEGSSTNLNNIYIQKLIKNPNITSNSVPGYDYEENEYYKIIVKNTSVETQPTKLYTTKEIGEQLQAYVNSNTPVDLEINYLDKKTFITKLNINDPKDAYTEQSELKKLKQQYVMTQNKIDENASNVDNIILKLYKKHNLTNNNMYTHYKSMIKKPYKNIQLSKILDEYIFIYKNKTYNDLNNIKISRKNLDEYKAFYNDKSDTKKEKYPDQTLEILIDIYNIIQ